MTVKGLADSLTVVEQDIVWAPYLTLGKGVMVMLLDYGNVLCAFNDR